MPSHAGIRRPGEAPPRPRPKKAPDLTVERFLEALRALGGSAAPRAIAEACEVRVAAVRRVSRLLQDQRVVTITGRTTAKRVTLVRKEDR